MGLVEELARAREAYERREWVAAYDALSDLDRSALNPDDFARLSMAAYLVGRKNDCIQAMQRAYQANLDAGDTLAAVRCGFWLALTLLTSGEIAVGGGWVSRCQRLLRDVPGDVAERGYVLIHVMMRHIFSGEYEKGLELAVEVTDYGKRFGDPNLTAQGLNAQGRMMIYLGKVREGLALLDEAMIGISTGQVSTIFAGEIYCSLIEACQEVSDYGRAAEWTSILTSWVDAQPGLVPFTGQCAVHRGQIMRVRGAFREAIEEFELAADRYITAETPGPAGLAMDECGGVLTVLGRLDAAEVSYERAVGFGHEPQPGLALLWLAQGRNAAALGAVRRVLAEPRDRVHRSHLLPGSVEVLLGTGDVQTATEAAEELADISDAFGCDAVHAMAGFASGSTLLAVGDAGAAVPVLRKAMHKWQALAAPYEVARCQVLIGRALRELGDDHSATGEFTAAQRAFSELGAVPAAREVARLLAHSNPGGLTDREMEVLRLVATGKSNPEIAAILVLSDKTVARHLSNIFGKLDVTSRTAASAFAFENKLL